VSAPLPSNGKGSPNVWGFVCFPPDPTLAVTESPPSILRVTKPPIEPEKMLSCPLHFPSPFNLQNTPPTRPPLSPGPILYTNAFSFFQQLEEVLSPPLPLFLRSAITTPHYYSSPPLLPTFSLFLIIPRLLLRFQIFHPPFKLPISPLVPPSPLYPPICDILPPVNYRGGVSSFHLVALAPPFRTLTPTVTCLIPGEMLKCAYIWCPPSVLCPCLTPKVLFPLVDPQPIYGAIFMRIISFQSGPAFCFLCIPL